MATGHKQKHPPAIPGRRETCTNAPEEPQAVSVVVVLVRRLLMTKGVYHIRAGA